MEFFSGWNWAYIGAVVALIIDNAIRITALFVVPRNRRPTSGMAWLLAIFLLPVPGLIVFLIIGSNRLPKHREAKQDAINELVSSLAERENQGLISDIDAMSPGLESAVRLGQTLGAQPMLRGNLATMTIDYELSFHQIAAAIDRATEYVHVQFYILVHDETTDVVFEAMRNAVGRGVKVRVMLDHISAVRNPGRRRTAQSLEDMGAEWTYMLPVRPWRGEYQRPDLRNHRKLVVVDGKVGFTGSQNLVDSSYNKRGNIRRGLHWRDIMVRVEGPIVLGLEAVFQADWYLETDTYLEQLDIDSFETEFPGDLDCQIVPSGPGYAAENNLQVFVSLLYTARRRISITSPYFVPDGSIMNALRAATARGVEVELFVSEIGDQALVYHAQRSYYEELLNAGVRIWMYRPPFILHSKHFTIDDDVAVVGSSNMDPRSFGLNMEISMVVRGASFVRDLDEVTDYYRANSRELLPAEWAKQPVRSQLLDGLARLTSALQ
ncbi:MULTISPECIES: cardiolipin synthase [Leucobacter]|uniref:cardiolipin synthase n=1 Tax=Leucobacter TaxID=55968 RepID=UPI000E65961D|nr:cardiolipin synthase [Leucobacter aridicollis]UTX52544.1 cardiolipin synthase [Leucobacter aridicollis]